MQLHDISVSTVTSSSVATVFVEGNLDFSTAATLRGAIDEVASGPARLVEIQFGRIGLMDSSGLGALVYAHKLSHARGKDFDLVGDDLIVARMLARTGLDRVFHQRRPNSAGPEALAAGA